jgi:hypothetical protein
LTTQPVTRELRLALLLADGTGDYDFVRAAGVQDMCYLEGHVTRYELKRRAEELARYVGYREVTNGIRVMPGDTPSEQ